MLRDIEWRLAHADPQRMLGAAFGVTICTIAVCTTLSEYYCATAIVGLTQGTRAPKAGVRQLWHRYQEELAWSMWASLAALVCATTFRFQYSAQDLHAPHILLDFCTLTSITMACLFGVGYVTCILRRYERIL